MDENKELTLFSCSDTDDEYFLYDPLTGEHLTTSTTDCEPELSTTEKSCYKISTANCEPDSMSFSNGQCTSPCLSFTISSITTDTSFGLFYWSESEPKLLVDKYEELETILVKQNFKETSYNATAQLTLECSPSTRQWIFKNPDHR